MTKNSKVLQEVPRVSEGNTNQKPTKKTVCQAKNWVFTFNNYTEADIQILQDVFNEKCKIYLFEKEIGENKTPHLQGYIELLKKARPTELGLTSKIHWEKCKSVVDSITYCQKDYQKGIITRADIYFKGLKIKKPLKLITPDRPYQKLILDIIKKEPDDRSIYWFWEPIGNVGKSSFVKYLVVKEDAIFIDEGKKSDIMNHCLTAYQNNNSMELFFFDIPRQNKSKISWKSIESIKNGLLYSPKYEGGQCVFNSPHIIIFSNFPPDVNEETISADRLKIYEIVQDFEAILQD